MNSRDFGQLCNYYYASWKFEDSNYMPGTQTFEPVFGKLLP